MRKWILVLFCAIVMVPMASSQSSSSKDKTTDKKDDKKTIPVITEIAGRSFEEWRKDLHSKDMSKREIAMKTILGFGPEKAYKAVPDIIDNLKGHKPPTKRVDLNVRISGTVALSTILQYYQMLKKEPDPKLLKATVAIFKTGIKDQQAYLKIRSLQALPYLGPISREVLPEVVEAISDNTTYETRKVAIETLKILTAYDPKAPPPAKAMEALYEALHDPSGLVRHTTLVAIPYVGFTMKEGILKGKILKRMNELGDAAKGDPDGTIRVQAHLSLIIFNPKIAVPLPELVKKNHLYPIIKCIKDSDPTTRIHALTAVSWLGKAGEPALPVVMSALDDTDINVALEAMNSIIHLRAMEAIPRLKKIMEDKSADPKFKKIAELTIDQLLAIEKMEKELKAKASSKGTPTKGK